MRRIAPILAFLLLAACGQAGDLYLPEPEQEPAAGKQEAAPEGAAPDERKPDRPHQP